MPNRTISNLAAKLRVGYFLLMTVAVASDLRGAPKHAISSVESIAITVSDLDRSARFFVDVLDFERLPTAAPTSSTPPAWLNIGGTSPDLVRLHLGDEVVELVQFALPGRPMPPDSRGNDRWFQHVAIITHDMDAAYARLQQHHVRPASISPQTLPDWNNDAAGIRAYYFRDPDGHFLEVLQFPRGKGEPKWHQPTDRLFLGIDHTAIVVGNTESSLRFYRDELGLRVVGGSENHGPEQERLNNVPGAHLRITTLRAPSGPGIELLEYLAPRDGRPYPTDSQPNDVWHWHVRLRADGATNNNPGQLQRDPDGHAILIRN